MLKKKTKKKKRDSHWNEICTYSILFMADMEDDILQKVWWRCIDEIFFLRKHGEEKLKSFIYNSKMPPNIKFTADMSKTLIKFLDVTISIAEGIIYVYNISM